MAPIGAVVPLIPRFARDKLRTGLSAGTGHFFLAGAVVDLADGAFYTREPRKAKVTLAAAEAAAK